MKRSQPIECGSCPICLLSGPSWLDVNSAKYLDLKKYDAWKVLECGCMDGYSKNSGMKGMALAWV